MSKLHVGCRCGWISDGSPSLTTFAPYGGVRHWRITGRAWYPCLVARTFWPKTIGTPVMVATTLVTALAIGRPTVVSGLFALAATALYLTREPATFALGYRGEE